MERMEEDNIASESTILSQNLGARNKAQPLRRDFQLLEFTKKETEEQRSKMT